MKVILSRKANGHLSVYVPKKDLEEEVVEKVEGGEGTIMTLANGWELCFNTFSEGMQLPQTMEAKKL